MMRHAGRARSRIEQSSPAIRFRSKKMAFGGGHVESRQVRAGEGAIRGALRREGMPLNDLAAGREDVHGGTRSAELPSSGGDDVALDVKHHAVDATVLSEVVENLRFTEAAVRPHGIGAELALLVLAAPALRDVEDRVVQREEQ